MDSVIPAQAGIHAVAQRNAGSGAPIARVDPRLRGDDGELAIRLRGEDGELVIPAEAGIHERGVGPRGLRGDDDGVAGG